MASRKNITSVPKETSTLTISNTDFVSKLEKRIEIGEQIYSGSHLNQNDLTTANYNYNLWTDYNHEMLKQAFN